MVRPESHFHETLVFPEGFLWGTATSAHQVEGNNTGSDWWQWEQGQKDRPKSGLACDHWHRFAADFDLANRLHNCAHRFSIDWARIMPKPDQIDSAAIGHYRSVLEALNERGLVPFVTLHHFTSPVWFNELGGWLKRRNIRYFEQYARTVKDELGSLIPFWMTFNEPMIYVQKGFFEGSWPPSNKSPWAMLRALKHLEAAHRQAYEMIKEQFPRAQVGIAHNMFSYQLYRPHHFIDRQFMYVLERFWNHSFLNHTKGHHDFVGLNYYFHYRLKKFNFNFGQFFVDPRDEARDVSDIGWEVFPAGITQVLIDLAQYKLPIYITENGIATNNDHRRVRFLITYLKEIYNAIRTGVDVRGYFYWSLLDNFEWDQGFGPRFGLVQVDFKTQRRRLKPSARIYAEIAKKNAIEHRLLKYLGHGIKVT